MINGVKKEGVIDENEAKQPISKSCRARPLT